jgi:hypothetical protein
MKRETPTEREIADLIASAYEGRAVPDARRLAAIEQRLPVRARGGTKSVQWWLAGALLAGAASALWWAVDYDSPEGRKPPAAAVSPATAPSTADLPTHPSRSEEWESKPADAKSKLADEPAQKAQTRGAVIYQREQ